ncbi:MAG: DUF420 domain-containing protein [Magnetospiraceae bacterium]
MTSSVLPHLNALFNGIATLCIATGFVMIRQGKRDLHRAAMVSALVFSAAFLIGYLAHHFSAPVFEFRGEGAIRPLYYTLLISHVILAVVVTPMIAITAWRALRERFDKHKKLARWTLPIWLYVSVTGVVVYFMLYHWFPGTA